MHRLSTKVPKSVDKDVNLITTGRFDYEYTSSHQLHTIMPQTDTNQIFSHPTTGTVPTTTEIWPTETKVLVSLLIADKITPNSNTQLLLAFSIVRYHKMLIIACDYTHVLV